MLKGKEEKHKIIVCKRIVGRKSNQNYLLYGCFSVSFQLRCRTMITKCVQFARDLSISKKLWGAMFVVNLIIVLIIVSFSTRLSSKVIIRQASEESHRSLSQIADKLDLSFETYETYTKMAIANFSLKNDLTHSDTSRASVMYDFDETTNIVEALRTFVTPRTDIESMGILSFTTGKIYSTNDETLLINGSNAMIADITESLDLTNLVAVGSPRKQMIQGVSTQEIYTLPLFMKVYDGYSGAPYGLIESDIPLSLLVDSFSKSRIGKRGEVFVIDDEGYIVVHHDETKITSKLGEKELEFCLSFTGEAKIFKDTLSYEVLHYPRTGWHIVNIVPYDELLAPSRRLQLELVLLGLFSMIITVFASFFISQTITKPLRKMENSMSLFEDPAERVYVNVPGKDEVGRLADVYNQMIDRISNFVKQDLLRQKQMQQYELSLLQSQMNPHFLNNILENACGLIELDRKEESIALILATASFYRSVLSGGELISTIEQELRTAELYIQIQNVRYNGKIQFSIKAEPGLLHYPIVKFTLQPLLENAIYHGLKKKNGVWKLSLVVASENDDIVITLSDNGVGKESEILERLLLEDPFLPKTARQHIGVSATHKRLQLLFGEQYGLKYSSKIGKGTTVYVRIPKEA